MKASIFLSAALCASTLSLSAQAPAPAAAASKDNQRVDQEVIDEAIAKVYPALARIHVIMERARGGRMEKAGGTGSGTIIHPDGYILTNHHVAGEGTRLWVRLSNKAKVDATLVGTDPQTDLCVIKLNMDQVPDDMKPLPVAEFGDFGTLEVGDTVMAMGSPAGVSQSVTLGVVANLEMITPDNMKPLQQKGEKVGDLVRWIGHDAVIYFGNSGGPLVNLEGKIIGINEIGLGSLGGAIPADIAAYVADELIKHGRVRRSSIGLNPQPQLESQQKKQGVLVGAVLPGSPAEKAGLKPGDIITSYDGKSVNASAREHLPVFNRLVLGTPVGKEVSIAYLRNGKSGTVKLTTEERSAAIGGDAHLPAWGITARDLTERSATALGRDNTDGVRVSSIDKTGGAASAKPALKPGDLILSVDGKSVAQLSDVESITSKVLAGGKSGIDTLVEFERGGELLATVVELGKEPNDSKSSAAKRAWLGVKTQVITRDLASALNLSGKKGVRVTQVIPGTLAAEAGFQKGDLILKLDGMVIRAERERDSEVFDSMIREYPSGEKVEFDLIRDGKEMKITCELETAPVPTKEYRKVTNNTLELTLRELAKDQPEEAEVSKGVFVEAVENAGWAALGGLRGGDIILEIDGQKVDTLEQIEAELDKIEKEKRDYIVLFVKKGKLTRFVEIHPIWN